MQGHLFSTFLRRFKDNCDVLEAILRQTGAVLRCQSRISLQRMRVCQVICTNVLSNRPPIII